MNRFTIDASPHVSQTLNIVLSHYFTLVDQEYLYINNKYYKTYIKMVHEPWPEL